MYLQIHKSYWYIHVHTIYIYIYDYIYIYISRTYNIKYRYIYVWVCLKTCVRSSHLYEIKRPSTGDISRFQTYPYIIPTIRNSHVQFLYISYWSLSYMSKSRLYEYEYESYSWNWFQSCCCHWVHDKLNFKQTILGTVHTLGIQVPS